MTFPSSGEMSVMTWSYGCRKWNHHCASVPLVTYRCWSPLLILARTAEWFEMRHPALTIRKWRRFYTSTHTRRLRTILGTCWVSAESAGKISRANCVFVKIMLEHSCETKNASKIKIPEVVTFGAVRWQLCCWNTCTQQKAYYFVWFGYFYFLYFNLLFEVRDVENNAVLCFVSNPVW